jgi:predicted NUDIX family NTP pyrophosphohydrolase
MDPGANHGTAGAGHDRPAAAKPRKAVRFSAGLLAYQLTADADPGLLVFLVHMAGPFWARRDAGAWSIPKGEFDPSCEDPRAVAAREFHEEVGVPAPASPWLELGTFRQPSGKEITAYAVLAGPGLTFRASNTFTMEWPRGSGKVRSFPEVDAAQWVDIPTAMVKLVPGQVPIIAALATAIGIALHPLEQQ